MSIELEEQAIRQMYRVISDPSWQVQKRHNGEWLTGFYCSSESGAYDCLERCVKRALEFSRMTPEDRLRSILRAPLKSCKACGGKGVVCGKGIGRHPGIRACQCTRLEYSEAEPR